MSWDELSMVDRAKYIQMGVIQGIHNINTIRDIFNEYEKERELDEGTYGSESNPAMFKGAQSGRPVEVAVYPDSSGIEYTSSDVSENQGYQLDKADSRMTEKSAADNYVHNIHSSESWKDFILSQAAGGAAAGALGIALPSYLSAIGTTLVSGVPTTAATLTGDLAGGLGISEIANTGYKAITGNEVGYMDNIKRILGTSDIENEPIRNAVEMGVDLLDPAFYLAGPLEKGWMSLIEHVRAPKTRDTKALLEAKSMTKDASNFGMEIDFYGRPNRPSLIKDRGQGLPQLDMDAYEGLPIGEQLAKLGSESSLIVNPEEIEFLREPLRERYLKYLRSDFYRKRVKDATQRYHEKDFEVTDDMVDHLMGQLIKQTEDNIKSSTFGVVNRPDALGMYVPLNKTIYISSNGIKSSNYGIFPKELETMDNAIMHEFGHYQYNKNHDGAFNKVKRVNEEVLGDAKDHLLPEAQRRLSAEDIEYVTDTDELRQYITEVLMEAETRGISSAEDIYDGAISPQFNELKKIYDKDFLIRALESTGVLSVGTAIISQE